MADDRSAFHLTSYSPVLIFATVQSPEPAASIPPAAVTRPRLTTAAVRVNTSSPSTRRSSSRSRAGKASWAEGLGPGMVSEGAADCWLPSAALHRGLAARYQDVKNEG